MVFLSKPLPSTSPVCSWKAGSEEKSTHQPRLSRVLLRWRTRKRELIMDGKIRGDASVLDIDLKSTIDSDVVNVYGEDCATADQPVTPCTFSVARDILEHILWNFVQTDTIN